MIGALAGALVQTIDDETVLGFGAFKDDEPKHDTSKQAQLVGAIFFTRLIVLKPGFCPYLRRSFKRPINSLCPLGGWGGLYWVIP